MFGRNVERCAQHRFVCRMQRLLGERLVHRFRQAEVDDLGHWSVVVGRDQNIRRFQIAVDDPLLMGVLDSMADFHEEFQAVGNGEPNRIAVFGDGNALDVFHHEKGAAAMGEAAVEHPGNVRVIHEGEGLPFDLEPG